MIRENTHHRLWEIDFLRGIAIVVMICFHFLYDLNLFGITHLSLYSGFFFFLAYGTASLFIILFGISLTMKFSQLKKSHQPRSIYLSNVIRGIKIFALGLIITLVTFWYIPNRFIVFGILHFIGLSLMISYPFLSYKLRNVFIGLVFILIGYYLRIFSFDFSWGLPIGFIPQGFSTVDYFPFFPWFGVVLIGIAIGNIVYWNGERRYLLRDYSNRFPIPLFCFLGRNSLIIYFLHQPVLLGLIYLFLQ